MKTLLVTTILILSFTKVNSQTKNQNYDSTLAKSLGSDDYGMKKYVLVILKTGTNKTTNKKFIDSCFAGHMSNMDRMVNAGKLVVAGPISKNDKTYRGIFILNAATIDEAKELLKSDSSIKENLLEPELFSWWGSAALPEYLKASDKIWKIKP